MRSSIEMLAALAAPLGLRLEMDLVPARHAGLPSAARFGQDAVHAAMGELEAAHLRRLGFVVAIDEPYQHFQFAGRADVLAWSKEPAALLHIENRTRFPNVLEAAGAWNAKRAYLAPVIAERLGLDGLRSITHVMACLWSAGLSGPGGRAHRHRPGHRRRSSCSSEAAQRLDATRADVGDGTFRPLP